MPISLGGGTLGLDTLGTLILGGWSQGADGIDDRCLVQMEDLPRVITAEAGNFRKLLYLFCELWLRQAQNTRPIALAFDVNTAVGQQQDMIGSVIDLPRRGFTDEQYRKFQRMQILLLLSSRREEGNWTGNVDNLVQIVRTFLGGTPGDGAIGLRNTPPYSYMLTVENLAVEDLPDLAYFLCRAQYAGVLGNVYFNLESNSLWDSLTAGEPIADTGVYGALTAGSTIANVAVYGTHVAIGGDGGDC
jgi:hypothetical protein